MKFWIYSVLLVLGVRVEGQIPFMSNGGVGGIPYPNQVTDIGVACLQYQGLAKTMCKPTPTEWGPFRAKCDQYRLYCKGLKAPSASTPDPAGMIPPPPPDVCPQVNYCAIQKGQYVSVCPRPADQDSVKFCQTYQAYCANVPEDKDGVCKEQTQQQQQFQQQQYQAMMAQQQQIAAQTTFNQPFNGNGNPFPFSQSQSMPGSFAGTGFIGRR